MDLKKIAQLDWIKRWNEPFSFLGDSYFGEQYIQAPKRDFGIGFTHLLFVYSEGRTLCYRLVSDTGKIGERLVEIFIQDPQAAEKWSEELIKKTDEVSEMLKRPLVWFMEPKHYAAFENLMFDYLPIFIRINIVPDYLPAQEVEKALPYLTKARLYSEHTYHAIDKLLGKITGRIEQVEGYRTGLLHNLLKEELRHYLKEKKLPSQEEMEDRYCLSGLYVNAEGQVKFSGDEITELQKLIADKQRPTENVFKGVIACSGRATGTARLIENPSKAEAFNDGDILVTSMTNPDFIPFMKRAGAIITEGGGVLSHAAITSRELKKPCIMNVAGIMLVLKDGDLVEVNAELGTLTIL